MEFAPYLIGLVAWYVVIGVAMRYYPDRWIAAEGSWPTEEARIAYIREVKGVIFLLAPVLPFVVIVRVIGYGVSRLINR